MFCIFDNILFFIEEIGFVKLIKFQSDHKGHPYFFQPKVEFAALNSIYILLFLYKNNDILKLQKAF